MQYMTYPNPLATFSHGRTCLPTYPQALITFSTAIYSLVLLVLDYTFLLIFPAFHCIFPRIYSSPHVRHFNASYGHTRFMLSIGEYGKYIPPPPILNVPLWQWIFTNSIYQNKSWSILDMCPMQCADIKNILATASSISIATVLWSIVQPMFDPPPYPLTHHISQFNPPWLWTSI